MDKKKLPKFLSSYFWDVDFSSLNLSDHSGFIIKRVLDRGNTQALSWLMKHFSYQQLKDVILESRDLSPKTANFWVDVWGLNRQKAKCLQKPYSRIPFGLSS